MGHRSPRRRLVKHASAQIPTVANCRILSPMQSQRVRPSVCRLFLTALGQVVEISVKPAGRAKRRGVLFLNEGDSLEFCSQNGFWDQKLRFQVSIQISRSKPKKKGHLSVTLSPIETGCLLLRGGDLNPRPLGYEPNELPLLHPALIDSSMI